MRREIEDIKKTQMKILELKNTIFKIKTFTRWALKGD